MLVHCPGTTGHGALLLPDMAGEKVRIIIDHFMDFREQEKKKLDSNSCLTFGDVTTVNLTVLKVIMIDLLHRHSYKVSGYESLSYNFWTSIQSIELEKEFCSVIDCLLVIYICVCACVCVCVCLCVCV
jgi:hypothetical protein